MKLSVDKYSLVYSPEGATLLLLLAEKGVLNESDGILKVFILPSPLSIASLFFRPSHSNTILLKVRKYCALLMGNMSSLAGRRTVLRLKDRGVVNSGEK